MCEEGTLDKGSSCQRTKTMQSQVEEAPTSLRRELKKVSKLHMYMVNVYTLKFTKTSQNLG